MSKSGQRARTAIRGGTVVTEFGEVEATLLIGDDGRVAALAQPRDAWTADEVVDAAGLLVLPGVVDVHCHLNDPGYTDGEDYYTGTCAAAAGGVTTVLDMPQSSPLVASPRVFVEKRAIGASKAIVDFALYVALTEENVISESGSGLLDLVGEGAIAFKAFTSDSPEMPPIPDDVLLQAFRTLAGTGLPVTVHCECQPLIDFYSRPLISAGRNDPLVNPDSRPPVVESEAVRRVIALAGLADTRVHLAHLSLPESFEQIGAARREGLQVTGETCPHYLALTRDDLARIGPLAMCNPPLRDAGAIEGLWQLLSKDSIDCIATDHGAYSDEEKSNPDHWQTATGISCIQFMLPLIVGEAARRSIPLSTLAAAFSARPARIFGLYPQKGALLPGSDADCVLVEPEKPWVVRGAQLLSKGKGTAFDGHPVGATVRRTLLRGRTIYVNAGDSNTGEIRAEPGSGRFLRPGGSGA